jgi:hypothetical protein
LLQICSLQLRFFLEHAFCDPVSKNPYGEQSSEIRAGITPYGPTIIRFERHKLVLISDCDANVIALNISLLGITFDEVF